MTGALSDVQVVSFAQLAQGPFAAQTMADLGVGIMKLNRSAGSGCAAPPNATRTHESG